MFQPGNPGKQPGCLNKRTLELQRIREKRGAFHLPVIECIEDITNAYSSLWAAVGSGVLTAREADDLSKVLDRHSKHLRSTGAAPSGAGEMSEVDPRTVLMDRLKELKSRREGAK